MGLILTVIIATAVITIIGGGMGYLIYLKTRPKKETWNVKVYQLGEGIREPKIDDKGKVISDLKLQDLRPFAKDVLEKVDKEPGITLYRLQKLNKTVPAPEADVVEYWGDNQREIAVLLHKGGCTLLKKGYDKDIGNIVFDPLPHSRIQLIKGEMAIRKDRLQKEKDILQAIAPWIVAGICMLGLVAIAYVEIEGFVKISENNLKAADQMNAITDKWMGITNIIEDNKQPITPEPHDLGQQEEIPSIEELP